MAQGEHAEAVPDGTGTRLEGTVTSIAVLPNSAVNPKYTVLIALDGGTNLPDGASATVLLHPAGGTGRAVLVPTSAVATTASGSHGPRRQPWTPGDLPVAVGASGPMYTEITGGLAAGQQVVLADLNAPLPTSGTGGRGGRRLGGGGGGGLGGRPLRDRPAPPRHVVHRQ